MKFGRIGKIWQVEVIPGLPLADGARVPPHDAANARSPTAAALQAPLAVSSFREHSYGRLRVEVSAKRREFCTHGQGEKKKNKKKDDPKYRLAILIIFLLDMATSTENLRYSLESYGKYADPLQYI